MNKKDALLEVEISQKENRGADLNGADLSGAYLRSADLNGADLNGADLNGADLSGADLRSADLRSADLNGAYLRSAKNIIVSSGLHDWLVCLVNGEEGPRVFCGCHNSKTIEEMRTHWKQHGDQQRRDVAIPILNGLEVTAKELGWIKDEANRAEAQPKI